MKKAFNKIIRKNKDDLKNEKGQHSNFQFAEEECIPYNPIVVDIGTSSIKGGFAGEDSPKFIFPTVAEKKNLHSYNSPISDIINPIERGIVQDWDAMEDIWYQTFFTKLKISPENHAILLPEKAFFSKNNCEKMAELLFEKFNVPKLYFLKSGVAGLVVSGLKTGIVLDCGEGVTEIIPIHEGFAFPRAIQTVNLGGKDVTDYFGKLLSEQGHYFHVRNNLEDLKEKCGYVELDYDKKMESKYPESGFEISNGSVINVGKERFRCAEVLFKPSLSNINCLEISYLLYKSIMECETKFQQDLCENIVLSGGTTMLPGMKERLEKDLALMGLNVKIFAPNERSNLTWIGSSIIAKSSSSFSEKFISQQDYAEHGKQIIGQKCFL